MVARFAISGFGERRHGALQRTYLERLVRRRGLAGFCFCSRALMRPFAAMLLCWKRYDSFPVSTIWQW